MRLLRGVSRDDLNEGDHGESTDESCPGNAITNSPRDDGFGAQFAALISIYSWSREHNRPFCITPWNHHAHDTQTSSSALFEFVGGRYYGPLADNITSRVAEKHMQLATAMKKRDNVSSPWHPSIRRFYWRAWKPPLRWFHPGSHKMVVHVRRGDVSSRSLQGRFLSNGLVAVCIMGALAHSPKATPVHLTSVGRVEDFGALSRVPGIQWHLDAPLMETFSHMASADSLIIAASTLSATAAFLVAGRGGTVFSHPEALTMLKYAYEGIGVRNCMAGYSMSGHRLIKTTEGS